MKSTDVNKAETTQNTTWKGVAIVGVWVSAAIAMIGIAIVIGNSGVTFWSILAVSVSAGLTTDSISHR